MNEGFDTHAFALFLSLAALVLDDLPDMAQRLWAKRRLDRQARGTTSTMLNLRNGITCVEDTPLADIAKQFGTPLYVYSDAVFKQQLRLCQQALAHRRHQIHYAVKANGLLHLLKLVHEHGLGFDIVSGGELARLQAIGAHQAPIIFSGVGKTRQELTQAITHDVFAIHVESEAEFQTIAQLTQTLQRPVHLGFRINPDVAVNTHPHISTGSRAHKFGIPFELALKLAGEAKQSPFLQVRGLSAHIGSQITDLTPYREAARTLKAMADRFQQAGFVCDYLDLGGGFGINYDKTKVIPAISDYLKILDEEIPSDKILIVEPGRSLIGPAGLLLTEVLLTKNQGDTHFAVVDASMTELIRPALYGAYHHMEVVEPGPQIAPRSWEIVGPVCETGDNLGHARHLPLQAGTLLAILDAGAYGSSMGSHYNSRPQAAEVWVQNDQVQLIREREAYDGLYQRERFKSK